MQLKHSKEREEIKKMELMLDIQRKLAHDLSREQIKKDLTIQMHEKKLRKLQERFQNSSNNIPMSKNETNQISEIEKKQKLRAEIEK